MPTYLYQCPRCSNRDEVFKKLIDLDTVETCQKCITVMSRVICAPAVRGDYAGYNCPVTGDWIEGKRAHTENLARHGCRVLETGEKEAAAQYRRSSDDALDKTMEDAAEKFVYELPPQKREQLVVEMESGLDVQIARQ